MQKITPLSPTHSKTLAFQYFYSIFEASNTYPFAQNPTQKPKLWRIVEKKWLKRGNCGKLWEIGYLFSRQKKPTQNDRIHWRVQLQTRRERKTFHPVETSGTIPGGRWQYARREPRIREVSGALHQGRLAG
jgi:hypothetical protein